jgi:hypothetical protein
MSDKVNNVKVCVGMEATPGPELPWRRDSVSAMPSLDKTAQNERDPAFLDWECTSEAA